MTEDEKKSLLENHGGELVIAGIFCVIGLVLVIGEPFHMWQNYKMRQELRSKPPIHEAKPYHVIIGDDTLHMNETEWDKWRETYNSEIRKKQMQNK
jgi:hypothetical protein